MLPPLFGLFVPAGTRLRFTAYSAAPHLQAYDPEQDGFIVATQLP